MAQRGPLRGQAAPSHTDPAKLALIPCCWERFVSKMLYRRSQKRIVASVLQHVASERAKAMQDF
eukprot:8213600-Prorocentrum_lima.AAC.1